MPRNIDVRVEGIRSVQRTLREFGFKAADLRLAWDRIGAKVKTDAMVLAPVLTGRLERSIRAGKTKSKATVRAGRANVPYAGVIHYGGYNNIQAHPFLTTALHRNAGYAEREVQDEIQSIIQRMRLGTFNR